MDPGVLGHHRQSFEKCLCHEYAIERVGVVRRQIAHCQCMVDGDVQDFEPRRLNLGLQICRYSQLSQAALDRYLPGAGGTDVHLISAFPDGLPGLSRYPPIVGEPPQQNVSIEQQTHSVSLERCLELGRKRVVEVLRNPNLLILPAADRPGSGVRFECSKYRHRLAGVCDNHPLTRLDLFDKPGQLSLGLADVHRSGHGLIYRTRPDPT
jgi:hypothetical protein